MEAHTLGPFSRRAAVRNAELLLEHAARRCKHSADILVADAQALVDRVHALDPLNVRECKRCKHEAWHALALQHTSTTAVRQDASRRGLSN